MEDAVELKHKDIIAKKQGDTQDRIHYVAYTFSDTRWQQSNIHVCSPVAAIFVLFLAAIRGKLVLRTQTVPLGGGSVQILRRDPHEDMNCLTAAVSCIQQSRCSLRKVQSLVVPCPFCSDIFPLKKDLLAIIFLRKSDDFEISSPNMRKNLKYAAEK